MRLIQYTLEFSPYASDSSGPLALVLVTAIASPFVPRDGIGYASLREGTWGGAFGMALFGYAGSAVEQEAF